MNVIGAVAHPQIATNDCRLPHLKTLARPKMFNYICFSYYS